jgi:hypothetical protein
VGVAVGSGAAAVGGIEEEGGARVASLSMSVRGAVPSATGVGGVMVVTGASVDVSMGAGGAAVVVVVVVVLGGVSIIFGEKQDFNESKKPIGRRTTNEV